MSKNTENKNMVGVAKFAVDLFNCLTSKGEALCINMSEDRLLVRQRNEEKDFFSSMLFPSDPRKSARAFGKAIEAICHRMNKKHPEFADAFKREIFNYVEA